MISVRNLRQQLSGNSWLLILGLAFLTTTTSCDLFKKVQTGDDTTQKDDEDLDDISGKVVFNPETGEYEVVRDVTVKLDTIRWKRNSPGAFPPITSDAEFTDVDPGTNVDDEGSPLASAYNVAMLLPFLTDRFSPSATNINEKSNWALHYYGGAQMAFDVLEAEGVSLNVSVLDSKANDTHVRSLLRNNEDIANADLIIGPYRKNNVAQVANYVKEKRKTFISPYSATANLSKENPNYVQVHPSLKTHCEAITEHVKKKYRIDQVVLVCKNKKSEIDRLKYFQNANFRVEGTTDTTMFEELIISDDSPELAKTDLMPFIRHGRTTVFVVPSWSSETFVYGFLRKLNIDREGNHVVVYGMPQWMSFENIDYDYYEKLNLHVSSASFTDDFDSESIRFKRQFYERFGTVARPEAYLGYDVTLFAGRMLKKYGKRFQRMLDRENQRFLQNRFQFEPVVKVTSTGDDTFSEIDQYENKHVFILRFRNYHFQEAE